MSLAFSPSGTLLAAAPQDFGTLIWDVNDPSEPHLSLPFSSDNNQIVRFEQEGLLRLQRGVVSLHGQTVGSGPSQGSVADMVHVVSFDPLSGWVFCGTEKVFKTHPSRLAQSDDIFRDQIAIGDVDGLVSIFSILPGKKFNLALLAYTAFLRIV